MVKRAPPSSQFSPASVAVGFDNAARDRQSHAGSFGFGGEEGLE
jgi:hypothetical protein